MKQTVPGGTRAGARRYRQPCSIAYSLLALAAMFAATVVLSACGAASPGVQLTPTGEPSASAAPTALSHELTRLDRLEVTRTDAFPQNHIRFAFPAQTVAADPAAVQAVARALLALPIMPSGVFHCPADLGIVYHLVFYAGSQRLPVVSLDATGCETVQGLGVTRWVARSPGFWRILGEALHLTRPGYATFREAGRASERRAGRHCVGG